MVRPPEVAPRQDLRRQLRGRRLPRRRRSLRRRRRLRLRRPRRRRPVIPDGVVPAPGRAPSSSSESDPPAAAVVAIVRHRAPLPPPASAPRRLRPAPTRAPWPMFSTESSSTSRRRRRGGDGRRRARRPTARRRRRAAAVPACIFHASFLRLCHFCTPPSYATRCSPVAALYLSTFPGWYFLSSHTTATCLAAARSSRPRPRPRRRRRRRRSRRALDVVGARAVLNLGGEGAAARAALRLGDRLLGELEALGLLDGGGSPPPRSVCLSSEISIAATDPPSCSLIVLSSDARLGPFPVFESASIRLSAPRSCTFSVSEVCGTFASESSWRIFAFGRSFASRRQLHALRPRAAVALLLLAAALLAALLLVVGAHFALLLLFLLVVVAMKPRGRRRRRPLPSRRPRRAAAAAASAARPAACPRRPRGPLPPSARRRRRRRRRTRSPAPCTCQRRPSGTWR